MSKLISAVYQVKLGKLLRSWHDPWAFMMIYNAEQKGIIVSGWEYRVENVERKLKE